MGAVFGHESKIGINKKLNIFANMQPLPFESLIHPKFFICTEYDFVMKKADEFDSYNQMQKRLEENPKPDVLMDIALESSTGEIFNEGSLYLFMHILKPEYLKYKLPVLIYYRYPGVVANLKYISVLSKQVNILLPHFDKNTFTGFVKLFIGQKIQFKNNG